MVIVHQLVWKICEVEVDLCRLQRLNHLPVEPVLDSPTDYIVVPVAIVQVEVGDICNLQSTIDLPCCKSLGK